MSKQSCFLYLEENPNPVIVENVLADIADTVQKINDHLYFFFGDKDRFAWDFISLEEGTAAAIRVALKKEELSFGHFLAGPLDQLSSDYAVELPEE
jgi:hypothetical protein|nr:MAG TPA: hypothetical protein [Caudoviricetes sp.]